MQWSRLTQWGLAALITLSLTILITPASAELKPGDKLDKSNCQEAKGARRARRYRMRKAGANIPKLKPGPKPRRREGS